MSDMKDLKKKGRDELIEIALDSKDALKSIKLQNDVQRHIKEHDKAKSPHRRKNALNEVRNIIHKAQKGRKGTGKKPNAWLEHIKKYHKKHPELTYWEAVKKARPSYKPKK